MASKATKLYNRVGLWQTRSHQAAAKGDYDRAGRLQTKAYQLTDEARRIEAKERGEAQ